ncbi:MAG: polysaccharide deacetylase family protein [Muribaculaceae bacterium]|nr:polysaccharide deacetylase family protein [Muribaculaceae bacterium]
MNILTFDIEEWYIEKFYKGNRALKYQEYDATLDKILALLEENNTKATFFCLGGLVEHFPHVIRKISAGGHEIGCHSNCHKWVNKMSPDEFKEDSYSAISALEDFIGLPVTSYRAPAFSIGKNTLWAFDVLAECGIINDASIFPGTRDFGGFPEFEYKESPSKIITNGATINEFPISLASLPIIKKQVAYSGGGYFRLLPLKFIKSQIQSSDYNMCYFHINDLLNSKSEFMSRKQYEEYFKEAGTLPARIKRYIKSNIGRDKTYNGIKDLLTHYKLISITEACSNQNTFPSTKL